MITCSPDYSLLTEKLSAMQGALLGAGASDGDLQMMLQTESGQLAWDISRALGPVSKSAATDGIEKDMRKVLTIHPQYSIFEDPERQGESSTADFTWLTATPTVLIGINDEDDMRGASQDDLVSTYRAARALASRGNAQDRLGNRGRQAVVRVNRVLVTQGGWNAVKRSISSRVGQLKASFARTAAALVPAKRIPGWVQDQIDAVITNGKSIFNDQSRQGRDHGYVEFGSRAKGVVSNPKVNQNIQGAIEGRSHILGTKLKKLLAGYAYNWRTGAVFKADKNSFLDN